jgi:hypothetical protein
MFLMMGDAQGIECAADGVCKDLFLLYSHAKG